MDLDLCDCILAIQFVVTTQSVFLCRKKKSLTVFVGAIGSYILLRCQHNLRGLSWYNRNEQTIYAIISLGATSNF